MFKLAKNLSQGLRALKVKAETDSKSKRHQQDSNLRPPRGTDNKDIRICRRRPLGYSVNCMSWVIILF